VIEAKPLTLNYGIDCSSNDNCPDIVIRCQLLCQRSIVLSKLVVESFSHFETIHVLGRRIQKKSISCRILSYLAQCRPCVALDLLASGRLGKIVDSPNEDSTPDISFTYAGLDCKNHILCLSKVFFLYSTPGRQKHNSPISKFSGHLYGAPFIYASQISGEFPEPPSLASRVSGLDLTDQHGHPSPRSYLEQGPGGYEGHE
jgi:hypothetical protein